MLTSVLRRTAEHLLGVTVEVLAELSGDHVLVSRGGARGAAGKVWQLEDHGRGEVAELQQIRVDVHVERHLSAALHLLLLGVLVDPAHLALGEQLLHAATADAREAVVSLLVQTQTEGAQAEGHDGAVVEDLGLHVKLVGEVLDVRDEQQVAGLVVTVVQGVVVHQSQQSMGLDALVAVLEDVCAQFQQALSGVERRRVHGGVAQEGRGVDLGRTGEGLVGGQRGSELAHAGRVQIAVLAPGLVEQMGAAHSHSVHVVLIVHVVHDQLRHRGGGLGVASAQIVRQNHLGELHQRGLIGQAQHVFLREK